MKVEFYLDSEKEIESVAVRTMDEAEPLEFLAQVQSCLENELPIERMEKDNYYVATLTRRYESNGAGGSYFDGYNITDVFCCTRYV